MHNKIAGKKEILAGFALLSCIAIFAFIQNTIVPLYYDDLETYFARQETGDFLRAYSVSEIILEGSAAYIYNPSYFLHKVVAHGLKIKSAETTGWLYPPVCSFILNSLALLPYKVSFVVWIISQAALFFVASYRFLWFRFAEAVVLCSPCVFAALSWGQNSVLLAALYIAAFRYIATSPIVSGIFFGCCIIKPQLGILIPFYLIINRYYKTFASACITSLLLIALSFLFYGTESWIMYWQTLTNNFSYNTINATGGMITISSGYRMPSVYNMMLTLGVSFNMSMAIQCICALGSIWILYSSARDKQVMAKNPIIAIRDVSILSLLAFPYLGIYDYTLATTSVLAMILRADIKSRFDFMDIVIVLVAYYILVIHASVTPILTPAIMALIYLCIYKRPTFTGFYLAT